MGAPARVRTLTDSDVGLDAVTDVGVLLEALLRGGEVPASSLWPAWPAVRRAAEYHRVLPLVAGSVLARSDVPADVAADLRASHRRSVVTEALREAELLSVLKELHAAAVGALLFKGAALAYTCYERPELRPRADTDLLVSRVRRDAADDVLRRLGYERAGQNPGDLVTYQCAYLKRRGDVGVHAVDLHWRTANPQVFGDVLPYEEAAAGAVSVPSLGEGARALSDVHALLVSCVHRIAHHAGDQRLIWLVDISRIAERLTEDGWMRFTALASAYRVATVCATGLVAAVAVCGAPVPASVLTALEGSQYPPEPTAAFLKPRRHAAVVAQDLASLPTWGSRARLVRQHVFPPASYMRETYAPGSRMPLPVLYLRRAWTGTLKWLART